MKKCKTVFFATLGVNLIAWLSPGFCDFYVKNIFPIWSNTYGRIVGLVKTSVGEWMIEAFLVILAVAVLLGIVTVIFFIAGKIRKNRRDMETRYYSFCRRFYQGMACLLTGVFLILTLNCFVLYHSSTFSQKYMGSDAKQKTYTVEELAEVRDYVVNKVNAYAKMMDRDEKGLIIYDKDMEKEAVYAMQNLGKQYPQLSGYYSEPKKIRHSDFMAQQYLQGVYFPFSLEANYNDVMNITCKPATMCHELAHTKGFIYEDDANFISFLACINSDDIFFQYSGYLSVLSYLDKDFKESLDGDMDCYNTHVKISAQVKKDKAFLTKDAWAEVEKKAVIKTATAKKATDTFIDTTLVMNGVKEGKASYGNVVALVMQMYEEEELKEVWSADTK